MDLTIFFLFFISAIIPMVLGFVRKIPILLIISGTLFLGLWAALLVGGFSTLQMTEKTSTVSYVYFPLYTAGNQTINMTQNASWTNTYTYTALSTYDNFITLLAIMCLGLGGTGLVFGFGAWMEKLAL